MGLWRTLIREKKGRVMRRIRYSKISEELYPQIRRVMERDKLYLNQEFSLDELCKLLGSNRTYVSYALSAHNVRFLSMLRCYRVDFLIDLVTGSPGKYDLEGVALLSGFPNARTMLHQLRKYHPDVYSLVRSLVKK